MRGASLLVAVSLACTGCADNRATSEARNDAAIAQTRRAPSSAEWLAQAARAHAAADQAIDRGDRAVAHAALLALLASPPPGALAAADRDAVLADVYARLAALAAEQGAYAEALAWADRGLALGRAEDALTFNLLLARARAHRGLGRSPEATADLAGARRIHAQLVGSAAR